MNTTKIIENKNIDVNTHQIKYKVGNSIFTVKSNFAGNNNLDDLVFEILKEKTIGNIAEISLKA